MRMIVAFEKTEQVRHVGHLDLQRAVQRALRRSGLPIRYSNGFNPHALWSFASPLPVGVSGEEELFEVGVEEGVAPDAFLAALSPAMPASLPVIGARLVEDAHPKLMASLHSAAYTARAAADGAARAMAQAVPALLAREEIIAIRKSKKGENPCDIRPMLYALQAQEEAGEAVFALRMALTERQTLKPDLLLTTLAQEAGVELPAFRLRRIRLFGERGGAPVPLMEL